jgi:probable rRNA maturation factor
MTDQSTGPADLDLAPGDAARAPRRYVAVSVRDGIDAILSGPELERIVARALDAAGAPVDTLVELFLTDDAEIAGLNERALGHAGPTDVLSFPLLPPGAFPPHPGQAPSVREMSAAAAAFVTPPGEPVHLGDIVVSVERAVAQAGEGRGGQTSDRAWSAAEELRLLVTHGALHLCGWDHAEPVEEAQMRALERQLLGSIATF